MTSADVENPGAPAPAARAYAGPVVANRCTGCGGPVDAARPACPGCGEDRPRSGWPLDDDIGKTIADRYWLVERLGHGTSGAVFRARDRSTEGELGDVVVKLMACAAAGPKKRRFLNEVRAARSISSPHAVKIYDVGLDSGAPFVVMELLRGKTLRALLDERGALEPEAAVQIAAQACRALADAHDAGIVHRDIKPENIMLLAPEHRFVKVVDFGSARIADPGATCSAIGTPRYMAPELIREEDVDARCDVYALGVCLFEMLAARPPFDAPTVAACLDAHLHRAPPNLARITPRALPPGLVACVLQMLEKSPDARPSSMREVEARLTASLEHRSICGPIDGSKSIAAPARPSSRARLAFGACALALLAVGAVSAAARHAGEPVVHTSPLRRAEREAPRNEHAAATVASPSPAPPPESTAVAPSAAPHDGRRPSASGVPASGMLPVTAGATAVTRKARAAASTPRSGGLREDEF